MNMLKKGHPVPLLLFILSFSVLLNACGADSPTGNKVQTKSGIVTVGTPTKGLRACISCHPATTDAWEKTRHANLNSSPSFTTGTCAVCHDKTGDSQFTSPIRMVVGCEACHSGGEMHANAGGAGPIGNTVYTATVVSGTVSTLAVSGQFLTCTGCHQLLDLVGDPASTTTPTTAMHSSTTGSVQVITDTHFATSPTWSTGGTGLATTYTGPGVTAVSGYVVDYNSKNETTCTVCHNPHGSADINREWALSAHADRFGDWTKYGSAAWARINWSRQGSNCQRCHTTTGYAAYANALETGDTTLATAIVNGVTITGSNPPLASNTSWKPEMLLCNGCHKDNRGSVRKPGAVTANYDYVSGGLTYAKASYPYPDASVSNLCMLCHVGRESGETIKGLNDPALLSAGTITSTNFSNRSLINSHLLTGGGTVYTATGYEFDGMNYSNITAYRHDQIGTSAAPGTGTSGPCVGCHMSRPNSNGDHLFLPIVRETINQTSLPITRASATVISIASEICILCHGPNDEVLTIVKEQKELFREAMESLRHELEKRAYWWRDGFRRFRLQGTGTLTLPTTVTLSSAASVTVGDYFRFDQDTRERSHSLGTYYKITGLSGTDITLEATYAGTIAAGVPSAFTIIQSTSVSDYRTKAAPAPFAVPDNDTTGATSAKNNMGAAFNFYLLEGDPAAYVHNRYYAKRLIYDSFDWIDDNEMNNSVGATLDALNGTTYPFKAGAMKYLLPNGVLGIPAERP